jgi:hypothetical protein
MDHICLLLPIVDGKSEAARRFQRELDTIRKADYAKSEDRIGITKELWFIASLPSGDHYIAYMESEAFDKALSAFAASRDSFDLWFKERLADVTGLDLNNPPSNMTLPELVSSYQAS